MCPPICKVVTSLIYDHFNLKFTSDSTCFSLLFCRLFHLFFKLIRCVLRVFSLIVVAGILLLIVFTPRYFDSYCVIIDFGSEFSSLKMLTTYFENYLMCFDCCECRYYCSNLNEILIFLWQWYREIENGAIVVIKNHLRCIDFLLEYLNLG